MVFGSSIPSSKSELASQLSFDPRPPFQVPRLKDTLCIFMSLSGWLFVVLGCFIKLKILTVLGSLAMLPEGTMDEDGEIWRDMN